MSGDIVDVCIDGRRTIIGRHWNPAGDRLTWFGESRQGGVHRHRSGTHARAVITPDSDPRPYSATRYFGSGARCGGGRWRRGAGWWRGSGDGCMLSGKCWVSRHRPPRRSKVRPPAPAVRVRNSALYSCTPGCVVATAIMPGPRPAQCRRAKVRRVPGAPSTHQAVVVAAGRLDPVADAARAGEVERRAAHRDDGAGGQRVGILLQHPRAVELQLVILDAAAAGAGQVPVGVVGQVDDGGRVGGSAQVDQSARRRRSAGRRPRRSGCRGSPPRRPGLRSAT